MMYISKLKNSEAENFCATCKHVKPDGTGKRRRCELVHLRSTTDKILGTTRYWIEEGDSRYVSSVPYGKCEVIRKDQDLCPSYKISIKSWLTYWWRSL